ncbi:MAG: hypothetical protein ACTSYA_09165 [Candidatus Kariarchaeaceae archaeon]
MVNKTVLQCACGETINSVADLTLVKTDGAKNEVTIICPNPVCIFQEIGRCRYNSDELTGSNLVEAKFLSSFSTWNAINNGVEKTSKTLKKMLVEIVKEIIPKDKNLKRRDK